MDNKLNLDKKLRLFAVTEDNVIAFNKKIDEIKKIIFDAGEEELSDRLENACYELFVLNMHINFDDGLNFNILSDVGEHIGQGNINKEEMEKSELKPDMTYWNRKRI